MTSDLSTPGDEYPLHSSPISPQKANSLTPNFLLAFHHVIELEGGYSNDADDPGGETKYGITRATLARFKYAHPGIINTVDIKNLTRDDALIIYKIKYWYEVGIDCINDPWVAMEVFEAAVNCGPKNGVIFAQDAYEFLRKPDWPKLKIDGVLGPITAAALNLVCSSGYRDALLLAMNGEQYEYYETLVDHNERFRTFARGWTRRLRLVTKETA